MKTWMVRAGREGVLFDLFKSEGFVGLGWDRVGDLTPLLQREAVVEAVVRAYPDFKPKQAFVAGAQLFRFAFTVKAGDRVVTYDPTSRRYACGEFTGDYLFDPAAEIEERRNRRSVNWTHERLRDELSQPARNSLGAIQTLFEILDDVAAELWDTQPAAAGREFPSLDSPLETPSADLDVPALAVEAVKDRLAALDWAAMQDLVAGLLRAMGYKTVVSPQGPDRGKDIVASPDGFGFQEPRIVVEVKHRKERIGGPDIRAFLGGRHPQEKGLFVSTGGFTQEARYEAERARIPLALMDMNSLLAAIEEHYERFDGPTRQLLPLRTVLWPIS